MLETPHVAVGLAIASKFPNPWIAIPLSLASHFILDKVPHWNPHTYTETMKNGHPSKSTFIITGVDITSSLILGTGFALTQPSNMFWLFIAASFASVLPDVSKYPFFLFESLRKGLYKKWVDYERTLQVDTKTPFWGIVTQVLVTYFALYTLLF